MENSPDTCLQKVSRLLEELAKREISLARHYTEAWIPFARVEAGEAWVDPRLAALVSHHMDVSMEEAPALLQSVLPHLEETLPRAEGLSIQRVGASLQLHVQKPQADLDFKPLAPML